MRGRNSDRRAKDEFLAKLLSSYAPFNESLALLVHDLSAARLEDAKREARALIYSAMWASVLGKGHKQVHFSGDRQLVARRVAERMSRRSGYHVTPEHLQERAAEYVAAIQVLDERHPPGFELSRAFRERCGILYSDIRYGMQAPISFAQVFGTTNEILETFETSTLGDLRERYRAVRPPAFWFALLASALLLCWLGYASLGLGLWPLWLLLGALAVNGIVVAIRSKLATCRIPPAEVPMSEESAEEVLRRRASMVTETLHRDWSGHPLTALMDQLSGKYLHKSAIVAMHEAIDELYPPSAEDLTARNTLRRVWQDQGIHIMSLSELQGLARERATLN